MTPWGVDGYPFSRRLASGPGAPNPALGVPINTPSLHGPLCGLGVSGQTIPKPPRAPRRWCKGRRYSPSGVEEDGEDCPSQLRGGPGIFRDEWDAQELVAFFFDDRFLFRMGNWKNVKFLPLLDDGLVALAIPIPIPFDDGLVALAIPIPFDDSGIFGLYDSCHRRGNKRCCDAGEDKLAH